jgi:hypothetical protein
MNLQEQLNHVQSLLSNEEFYAFHDAKIIRVEPKKISTLTLSNNQFANAGLYVSGVGAQVLLSHTAPTKEALIKKIVDSFEEDKPF